MPDNDSEPASCGNTGFDCGFHEHVECAEHGGGVVKSDSSSMPAGEINRSADCLCPATRRDAVGSVTRKPFGGIGDHLRTCPMRMSYLGEAWESSDLWALADEVAALRAERDERDEAACRLGTGMANALQSLALADAEVERMRPVVEAAGTYVASGAFSQYTRPQAEDMLRDAVDAYRAATSDHHPACVSPRCDGHCNRPADALLRHIRKDDAR
ncbi:MAG: hypothetical protein JWL76_2005 [Thermoleophilia bacterium]|nr:hypothetical protein [Thermoleophilia bacterium]